MCSHKCAAWVGMCIFHTCTFLVVLASTYMHYIQHNAVFIRFLEGFCVCASLILLHCIHLSHGDWTFLLSYFSTTNHSFTVIRISICLGPHQSVSHNHNVPEILSYPHTHRCTLVIYPSYLLVLKAAVTGRRSFYDVHLGLCERAMADEAGGGFFALSVLCKR